MEFSVHIYDPISGAGALAIVILVVTVVKKTGLKNLNSLILHLLKSLF